jgi:hypothetical protein
MPKLICRIASHDSPAYHTIERTIHKSFPSISPQIGAYLRG